MFIFHFSSIFWGVFKKIILPLALDGYEMVMVKCASVTIVYCLRSCSLNQYNLNI